MFQKVFWSSVRLIFCLCPGLRRKRLFGWTHFRPMIYFYNSLIYIRLKWHWEICLYPCKRQPHKMVKHSNYSSAVAGELFEFVWLVCGVIRQEMLTYFLLIILLTAVLSSNERFPTITLLHLDCSRILESTYKMEYLLCNR